MKLTKTIIDTATYQGKSETRSRYVLWDSKLRGFGLRVTPSEAKIFVLSYRAHGRKRLMTIGNYGTLTPDEARRKARKHLVAIEDGEDPLETRRRLSKAGTVAELCAVYLEQYARVHKRSWKDDERRIHNRIIPAWGNLKAASVQHADVEALHIKIGKEHPYEANRTIELISKMFERGKCWGFAPGEWANPAKGIESFYEHKRDRWVTPDELPRLAQAIDQEVNLYARYALWLYLLTGMRKMELLTAKWEYIDWERRELRIPQTKGGRVLYMPLTEAALTLLRNIPQLQGNPFVLPGAKEGKHLVNISKPWRRIRKAAGIPDVRLHDLRRTVGSWLAQAGNSLHLIGRILNHSTQSTTAVYARFAQDHVRQALEAHGKRILGVAGKESGADPVDIDIAQKRSKAQ
jgi:integrase